MARTRYQEGVRKYLDQEQKIKEDFRNFTGKKNSRGILKDPAFGTLLKRVRRNKGRFKKRYAEKRALEIGRKSIKTSETLIRPPETKSSTLTILSARQIFHIVLSYGSRLERAIQGEYNLQLSIGRKVSVIFSHAPFGQTFSTVTQISTDTAFQRLYFDCLRIQEQTGNYPLVNAVLEQFNKINKSIITITTVL